MNLKPSFDKTTTVLQKQVYDYLDQLKAIDIVSIDLFGKSSLADYMLIASGSSQRHVIGMAQKVMEFLHHHKVKNVRVEGLQYGDWVLIDGGDLIIHLFRPEVREFYNLEKMWNADFEALRSSKSQA